MNVSLKELIAKQQEFDRSHAGKIPFYTEIDENNLSELEHLVVCLLGELGEFANILKKVRRGDKTLAIVKNEMDEELVDVFIYLLKIAGQFNVDLEDGYGKKMQANSKRFERYKK